MCCSGQRDWAIGPGYSFLDKPFFIILELLSWMGKMLDVHLRWQSEWGTTDERVLGAGKFNADQVSLKGEQLCHAKCPIGTKARG